MKSLLNSFAFRLWALFAISGIFLSVTLGYYYNNKNYKILEKRANVGLEAMARSASLGIQVSLKSNNFQIIEETINQISKDNNYAFIALLEREDNGYKLFRCFPDSMGFNKPYHDSTTYYLKSSDFETDIINGKIILGTSKEESREQLKYLNRPIWQLTYIANFALLLLSAFFFILVTNPIRKASRFASELSKRNYNVELRGSNGKNEISILNNSLITLKHNLVKHKETSDELLNNLNFEIEKQTEEIKVKSRLQKKLQENELKLKNSLVKEKELGVLKTSFVSMASHQFKTPLAVIQANAELYEMLANTGEIIEPKKSTKVTGRIIEAIGTMSNLIDEVLALGKVTSGNVAYTPENLDLVGFCEKLAKEFNAIQADGRSLDFVKEGHPIKLQLDPILLTHSLSNLISNAFKYSVGKENPQLRIHFKPKEVVLSVNDYGLGIPEEEHLKLFTPFFRANNVTDIKGSGLGLNIAKEYVELNKGQISVKSKLGEGSCFEITFKR